jgi:hypothetical protein
MARNPGLIEEGRERFEGALKDMERDWKRLQRRADQGRKQFEQRAQKQVKRIQAELRKSPLVKRAEELRKDAGVRIETQIESLFGLLRIASASEVSRLERKVDQLNRKLRELEKGNSPQAAA